MTQFSMLNIILYHLFKYILIISPLNRETPEGQNGIEGEDGDAAANVEEERKELTLDEWKALKGTRSKPQYNLRKAGEGEDLSQWKKMYALQKKKEEEEDEDDEVMY